MRGCIVLFSVLMLALPSLAVAQETPGEQPGESAPAGEGDGSEEPAEKPPEPPAPPAFETHEAIISEGGSAEMSMSDGAKISLKVLGPPVNLAFQRTAAGLGHFRVSINAGELEVRIGKNPVCCATGFGEFVFEGMGTSVIVSAGADSTKLSRKGGESGQFTAYIGGKAFRIPPGGWVVFTRAEPLPEGEDGVPAEAVAVEGATDSFIYRTGAAGSISFLTLGSPSKISGFGNLMISTTAELALDPETPAAEMRAITVESGHFRFDLSSGGAGLSLNAPNVAFSAIEGKEFTMTVVPEGLSIVSSLKNDPKNRISVSGTTDKFAVPSGIILNIACIEGVFMVDYRAINAKRGKMTFQFKGKTYDMPRPREWDEVPAETGSVPGKESGG